MHQGNSPNLWAVGVEGAHPGGVLESVRGLGLLHCFGPLVTQENGESGHVFLDVTEHTLLFNLLLDLAGEPADVVWLLRDIFLVDGVEGEV